MGRSLKSMLAELPPERRAWIEAKGREMADDMIRYADALAGQDLELGQDQANRECQEDHSDVDLDSDPGGTPG